MSFVSNDFGYDHITSFWPTSLTDSDDTCVRHFIPEELDPPGRYASAALHFFLCHGENLSRTLITPKLIFELVISCIFLLIVSKISLIYTSLSLSQMFAASLLVLMKLFIYFLFFFKFTPDNVELDLPPSSRRVDPVVHVS